MSPKQIIGDVSLVPTVSAPMCAKSANAIERKDRLKPLSIRPRPLEGHGMHHAYDCYYLPEITMYILRFEESDKVSFQKVSTILLLYCGSKVRYAGYGRC